MSTLAIDQAIAKVPFLAESKNIKKIPLSGGITNLNFRIDADGKSYVLRLTGQDTELLGIRRDVEYAANYTAGQLGIAPEVMYFIEPEGYIVTRFIKGKTIPPDVIKQSDYLTRITKKIRLFHARAPKLNGEFNVFRRVEMLAKVSKKNNGRFPFDWDWMMQKMAQVEEAMLKNPHTPTPCHDDLLNLNWLEEDVPGELGEIRLLDWEYAGMNDPVYDLANFSSHHGLNDEQIRFLLNEYFGEATLKHIARLKLLLPMSEIHEAMWGTTQTGISKLEEDFQGYADLWFGRVRQHVTDPRWEGWLKEVAKKGN
ncbi:MAG TPA: choline/ethanolamine kinase family protein [Anaerolineales bacterium]